MSYGKIFKMDSKDYLLEIFDRHVYIALKNSKDDYTPIYEGDYQNIFDNADLRQLETLEYEDKLYAILLYCLERKALLNRKELYQSYIAEMMKCHTKDEILSSASDEMLIYATYYPLDMKVNHFIEVTTALIEELSCPAV